MSTCKPQRLILSPPLFPQMEARAALALLAGRFRLSVAPRMGDREAVRAAEVMKLTL